jgi:hypothetical protein
MTNFYKDVENHKMTVVADSGVNRHILFKQENTSNYHFSLTTWSGYLCISGDMGTYVFSRLPDMFQFFRTENGGVNLSYWGEKCVAASTPITRYSADIFIDVINTMADEYIVNNNFSAKKAKKFKNEVDYSITSMADSDTQRENLEDAMSFEFEKNNPFLDINLANLEEDDPRYIWCCHAIAWGIKQYYESKKNDVIMSVDGKVYTCKDLEDASRKYQWLRDLSTRGAGFPPATLSDGCLVDNDGRILYDNEVVLNAVKIY